MASLNSILVNLLTTGTGGKINLLLAHKSEEDETFVSLDGTPNEYTDLGVCDGTPFTALSAYKPRSGDKLLPKLVYSGNGLESYPEIDKIIWDWNSDITAPADPVITTAIAANENIAVIQCGDLPADAYANIFEIDVNGAGSLPLSERNKIESGHGHLRLVGPQTEVEQQAERNSKTIAITGLAEGDVLNITAFARDRVGNQSAGKLTSITMSGAQYVRVPVENYKVVWGEDKDWNVRWQ